MVPCETSLANRAGEREGDEDRQVGRELFMEWRRFEDGSLTLDLLTRQYIHQHYQYQYLVGDHSKEAFTLEKKCQGGEIFGKKTLLNPL